MVWEREVWMSLVYCCLLCTITPIHHWLKDWTMDLCSCSSPPILLQGPLFVSCLLESPWDLCWLRLSSATTTRRTWWLIVQIMYLVKKSQSCLDARTLDTPILGLYIHLRTDAQAKSISHQLKRLQTLTRGDYLCLFVCYFAAALPPDAKQSLRCHV